MAAPIGIDLGTTNSCVAVVENGRPEVIPNRAGYKTTPSIVAFTESGKRLVGHIAKRQSVTNASSTVSAAKRLIGRKWGSPEVERSVRASSYKIVEGPHADVRVELRGNVYSIPELSAFILQEMKLVAEAHLGEPVEKAVITVPAYFNDAQRQATKDAGRIAGLDVIRIINEPTAAALAYGYARGVEKKVVVFDLGGGTFDVSVLALADGVFEVVATGGDTFLGGEDFDARILDWLADAFQREHGMDLRLDKMALQRLKDAAEKAKCELSLARSSEINLPFIAVGAVGDPLHLVKTLTRDELERLTGDLVQRCIEIAAKVLGEAKMGVHDIDDVLLVGGMTRMPRVQRAVAEHFGREGSKGVHPDEVVALGAAIQAASLTGGSGAHPSAGAPALLLDVTPHALGIMIAGGYYHKLIEKNTTVPCQQSHIFTTVRDGQTTVKILVLQGDGERAEHNELLGEFMLTGLRPAPRGAVEIEVTFSIGAEGILSVSARDLETGRQQAITVSASSGLTESEIREMAERSAAHMVEARKEEAAERGVQDVARMRTELVGLVEKAENAVAAGTLDRSVVTDARRALARTGMINDGADAMQLAEMRRLLEQALELCQGALRGTG